MLFIDTPLALLPYCSSKNMNYWRNLYNTDQMKAYKLGGIVMVSADELERVVREKGIEDYRHFTEKKELTETDKG